MQFVADEFDELEARVVGLHDDVEQHGSNVRVVAHQDLAFGRRIGRQDFQRLAVQRVVAERKARAFMDSLIVIDHGDLPLAQITVFRHLAGVFDQIEDIVLFGHCVVPSIAPAAVAARGMIMRKVVPCPSLESSIIRPPSCWVTRL